MLVFLWAIPFFLFNSYASLYAMKMGVTAVEVGIINSVSFILKSMVALIAGLIVNKLGRRKSVAIFDLISWVASTLVLAFASNFWHFLLAAILNSFTVINTIASQCFFCGGCGARA